MDAGLGLNWLFQVADAFIGSIGRLKVALVRDDDHLPTNYLWTSGWEILAPK